MYNSAVKLLRNKFILSLSYVHNKNSYFMHCCKYQNVLSNYCRTDISALSILRTMCPQGAAAFRMSRSNVVSHYKQLSRRDNIRTHSRSNTHQRQRTPLLTVTTIHPHRSLQTLLLSKHHQIMAQMHTTIS